MNVRSRVCATHYYIYSVTEPLHNLFIALMADIPFKARLATAYAQTLARLNDAYARGRGVAEHMPQGLSVQVYSRS